MEFLSMNEYLNQAKKIMLNNNCFYLAKDDDAVGEVASRMMMADHTWNGNSSRETWRYNQAWYAITKILKRNKKHKDTISLSTTIRHNSEGGRDVLLSDVIEHKETTDPRYTEICNIANKILSGKTLDCFNMYYKDGYTFQEIGDRLGFSKQRAEQCTKSANKQIKQWMLK